LLGWTLAFLSGFLDRGNIHESTRHCLFTAAYYTCSNHLPFFVEKGFAQVSIIVNGRSLAAAIVPTHLLTSLALVLMLAALSAAKRSKILLPIIGLCLVLIVSWDVTGGGHIFESVTSHPLLSVAMEAPDQQAPTTGIFTVNPANIAKTEITQHLRGSESHIAVVKVRILHASIFTLIGLAGAVFVLLRRRTSNTIAILAITLAPLLLLPISGHYGEELLNRVYLFVLPFMGYFGAMLLDMRGKLPWLVFCLLLIVAIPTNIISTYGNQALDYFPEGRVAGLKFFDSTTTYGYVTGAYPLGDTGNILQYKHLDYPQLEWQGNDLATRAGEDIPYYIAISNYDRAWYEWFLGNPYYVSNIEQLLDNAGNCSLIYCNPVLKIYESNK